MVYKIPVAVAEATSAYFQRTKSWQTQWTSDSVSEMPNKVALHWHDDGELLGLMSYESNQSDLAVEIIYLESTGHSNANLFAQESKKKKYYGIAKALFAYAAQIFLGTGFGGIIFFKAKTTRLREYYIRQFGAMPLGHYDPFRLSLYNMGRRSSTADV